MSASALGDTAVCGRLVCSTLENKAVNRQFGTTISAAGALPINGIHFVAPAANPTAFTLADGNNVGDVVELIHAGGGNVANIAAPSLHGAAISISMTGGMSVKCVWGGPVGGLAGGWYLTGRESTSAAASAVVALPTIAA